MGMPPPGRPRGWILAKHGGKTKREMVGVDKMRANEKQTDYYVSTAGLMEILNISRSTVNRLVDRGLPHIWVGAVRRFPMDKVIDWLERRKEQPGITGR